MASAKQLLHSDGRLHVALVKVMVDIKDSYINKIRSILNEEEPKALYTLFLGLGQTHRVNQFIFKHRLDYLDYTTDSRSESEKEPSKSKPKRKKMVLS